MGKSLMIMGTASSVGKSVITTGLCRIFYREGINVNPFKSQNMALNSYITVDGHEMGRAQVVQAEAAGKLPNVRMNPILIKPSSDVDSQVIVEGKVFNQMNASGYHKLKPQLKEIVRKCYVKLENDSDLVIIEGAGSPAEINLRDGDLVNMGMAELSDSPVIIVGDIDKGGVFAALYGTIMLLPEHERSRVKGVIINKFRGDIKLLDSGLKMLEDLIHIPVLGVIPWNNIDIEDEDSLSERFKKNREDGCINVAILKFPHMSNYTDFNILELNPELNVKYISDGNSIGNVDIIILPGSKSVISDFNFLKKNKWDKEIYDHNSANKTVIGICGGYQMLGMKIEDPLGVEGTNKSIIGLKLLDITTVFEKDKKTTQNHGVTCNINGYWNCLSNIKVEGYEIHMGRTVSNEAHFILNHNGECEGSVKGNILGTYYHGIFDNTSLTSTLINNIKSTKGIKHNNENIIDYKEYKNNEFDKLADLYEEHLDIKAIKRIIEEW